MNRRYPMIVTVTVKAADEKALPHPTDVVVGVQEALRAAGLRAVVEAEGPRWAVYTATAKYSVQGITLVETEGAALDVVAEYLRIGHERDPRYADRRFAKMDRPELYETLQELADSQDAEWFIQEVRLS